MHFGSLFILLLELVVILVLSRALGMLFLRFRQPMVIGEMIAGILLGPTLLGWLAPSLQQWIFPPANVSHLSILSQLGVTFFMFLVGLELDPRLLRERGKSAVVVSAASIIAPFVLGVGVTYFLRDTLFDSSETLKLTRSAIFMGVAMSAMAFPVLARILTERNLHQSPIGVVCITAAAVGDVVVWCILAFVVAMGNLSAPYRAIYTVLGVVAYAAFTFFTVRPFLAKLDELTIRHGKMHQSTFAIIMALVIASAGIGEMIGVHALLGAFLIGAIMPKRAEFVRALVGKLEDFVVVVLLPMFFAYTGLKTDLRVISQQGLFVPTLLLIAVACIGKFGGAGLSARFCGMGWRDSLAIGTLLNTRGLIELVILTIGMEEGVIGQAAFAAMVVMALVTTAMTSPLLFWIYPTHLLEKQAAPLDQMMARMEYGIVIPISLPATGPILARLAERLRPRDSQICKIYAVHLNRPAEHEAYRAAIGSTPSAVPPALDPLLETAGELKLSVEPISFMSRDIPADIARVARNKKADLILMGFHNPVFSMSILGGAVHRVLTGSDNDVAIFVDRDLETIRSILVPYAGSPHDQLALQLAAQLARSSVVMQSSSPPQTELVGMNPTLQNAARAGTMRVRVLHVQSDVSTEASSEASARAAVVQAFEHPSIKSLVDVQSVIAQSPTEAVVMNSAGYDLVLIGVGEEWGLESQLFGTKSEDIAEHVRASLLIVRKAG